MSESQQTTPFDGAAHDDGRDVYRLKEIETDEVSVVPKGANGKRWLLLKADDAGNLAPTDNNAPAPGLLSEQMRGAMRVAADGEDSMLSAMKAAGATEDACLAAKGALRLMSAYRDQIPDDAMHALASLTGKKTADVPPQEREMTEQNKSAEVDVSKQIDEKIEAAKAEVAKAAEAEKQALAKALDEANAKTAEIAKALESERTARLTKEAIEKAAKDFPNVPGVTADALGPALMAVEKSAPDAAKVITEALKAADALIAKSKAFESVGKNGSANTGSVAAEIQTRAEKLVADKVFKSVAEAKTHLYSQDKTLAQRERDEAKAAR